MSVYMFGGVYIYMYSKTYTVIALVERSGVLADGGARRRPAARETERVSLSMLVLFSFPPGRRILSLSLSCSARLHVGCRSKIAPRAYTTSRSRSGFLQFMHASGSVKNKKNSLPPPPPPPLLYTSPSDILYIANKRRRSRAFAEYSPLAKNGNRSAAAAAAAAADAFLPTRTLSTLNQQPLSHSDNRAAPRAVCG